MKILYAAGRLDDSNIRLGHFLRHTNHDVKVAAYYKNSDCLSRVHWMLDALEPLKKNTQEVLEYINYESPLNIAPLLMMIDDISEWNPDLFVIDYEPISAAIAQALDIPFISCSPAHLLDGVKWPKGKKTKVKANMKAFDGAIEKLIYCPFGRLENAPELLEGFDWIQPYEYDSHREGTEAIRRKIEDGGSSMSIGTSGSLSKIISGGKSICVLDSPEDIEGSLNGIFVDTLGLGVALGKAETNMSYASKKIDSFLSKDYSYKITDSFKRLHERLEYDT